MKNQRGSSKKPKPFAVRSKSPKTCEFCGIHLRMRRGVFCVDCAAKSAKHPKAQEEKRHARFAQGLDKYVTKALDAKREHVLAVGDAVTVKIKKKEIPGNANVGSFFGYLAHRVRICSGWAVYIPSRRTYVFVSEEALTYEPAHSPATREELNVYTGPFPDHEDLMVEIHPDVDRYADSIQHATCLAEFKDTDQFLVHLTEFVADDWSDGYEMVTGERIFTKPKKHATPTVLGQAIMVQDPNSIGFWRATYRGNLEDQTVAVCYDNANCEGTIFRVQPDWIYEVVKK